MVKLNTTGITSVYKGSDEIVKIYKNTDLVYEKDTTNYEEEYFTITSLLNSNTIKIKTSSSTYKTTIYWSTDKVTWNSVQSSVGGTTITTLNSGNSIYLKHDNIMSSNTSSYNYFTSTKLFNVSGNIMSLLYGDNFVGRTDFKNINGYEVSGGPFVRLFRSSYVVDAKNLKLPGLIPPSYAYCEMFAYCSLLQHAPELPATKVNGYAYYYMFLGCTSLTTAPELPATTLGTYCYRGTFYNCTALTTAPSTLPAAKLRAQCYLEMFYGCTSLTTAPEILATTYTAGEGACCSSMFNGCTSLNYIKWLWPSNNNTYTYDWVSGVSSTGTFVKASGVTWPSGDSGIPTGWTVQEV